MGDEAKRTNPFLSYVEPNAIVAPEMYEKCALYGLLYTSIANDLVDQGFTDSMTLNVMVTARAKEYVSIMEKLLTGAPLTAKEREAESNVRSYMKLYVPIDDPFNDDGSVNLSTRDANLEYIRDFKKQYTRVVGEMGKIIAYAKANGIQLEHGMLTRDQVELLLLAKREKCREFYDMVRANCDGKPGKIDKKDGSSKEGVHLRLYREGKNKVLKDKDKIKKESRKNALKIFGSVALWAAFGASIVFTAGALSPTLAGLVGSGMSATSLGQFFTGAIASIFSFRGGAKLTRMSVDGVKANYKRRKDLKEFIGPRITAERLEAILANYGKDSKDLTFNERKALLMFDKAAKMYFEKGKVEGEFDGEPLAKYLPQELIDKYKYAEDARRFRLVSDKGQLYDKMFLKLPNEPTELVGDGKMGRSDVRSLYNQAMNTPSPSLDSLQKTIQRVESGKEKIGDEYMGYMANLGTKVGDAVGTAFFGEPHTKSHANDVNLKVTKIPAFTSALGQVPDVQVNIENSYAYYQTVQKNTADSPLRDDIGVSLTAQLTFDRASMVAASKAIPGVTLAPAHEATVDTIANAIVSLSSTDGDSYDAGTGAYVSTDNVGAIQAQIATLSAAGVDSRVTNYLTHMLSKKTKSVSNSVVGMTHRLDAAATAATTGAVVDVPNGINGLSLDSAGNVVGSVTGYSTVEEAKQSIMSSGLTDTQKAKAVTMLEEKVQALEADKRNETLQASITTINASKKTPVEMKNFQEKLAKIDFKAVEDESVDGMSFIALVDEYITGGTLRDYNRQLFQQAIAKAIEVELKKDKYKTDLDACMKILKVINTCKTSKYLTEGQTIIATQKLEVLLESSIDRTIDDTKRNIFEVDKYKKLMDVLSSIHIRSYTDPTKPGLKEYFESNTPKSRALKAKIDTMTEFNKMYQLLIKDDAITDVTLQQKEGMDFAEAYFFPGGVAKNRAKGDPLRDVLVKMQEASQKHKAADYDIQEVPSTRNTYVAEMETILDSINASTMSDEEKYAAILIAKKRIVAMYKSYVKQIVQKSNGVSSFANLSQTNYGEAAALLKRAERLSSLFGKVDTYGAAVSSKYIPVSGILTSTQTDNAPSYATSPEM